jgi:hypothetical protein
MFLDPAVFMPVCDALWRMVFGCLDRGFCWALCTQSVPLALYVTWLRIC